MNRASAAQCTGLWLAVVLFTFSYYSRSSLLIVLCPATHTLVTLLVTFALKTFPIVITTTRRW